MTNNHPAHFAPCAPSPAAEVALHPTAPCQREPGGLDPNEKMALEVRLRKQMLARAAQNN